MDGGQDLKDEFATLPETGEDKDYDKAVEYSALSPVFSTNVVCVKTQQKHARIKHHDRTKQ